MPILEPFPCWRRFGQFSSPIRGVCRLLTAFGWINVEEALENAKLRAELFSRCDAVLQGVKEHKGTKRLIRQADGTDRELWIPGILEGTGIWRAVRDAEGKPELERDKWGRVVNGPDGKPKIKAVWVPPLPPLEYVDEPIDTWSSFAALAERSPKQTIRADCDCLSPVWCAYWHLRGVRAGLGITQPRTRCCQCERGKACPQPTPGGPQCKRCGYGMAHAYTVLDEGKGGRWRYFDGSSLSGMGAPKPEFYGSGETAIFWLD